MHTTCHNFSSEIQTRGCRDDVGRWKKKLFLAVGKCCLQPATSPCLNTCLHSQMLARELNTTCINSAYSLCELLARGTAIIIKEQILYMMALKRWFTPRGDLCEKKWQPTTLSTRLTTEMHSSVYIEMSRYKPKPTSPVQIFCRLLVQILPSRLRYWDEATIFWTYDLISGSCTASRSTRTSSVCQNIQLLLRSLSDELTAAYMGDLTLRRRPNIFSCCRRYRDIIRKD